MRPSWDDAPEWARSTTMDLSGLWVWHEMPASPSLIRGIWTSRGLVKRAGYCSGCHNSWIKSLEVRPFFPRAALKLAKQPADIDAMRRREIHYRRGFQHGVYAMADGINKHATKDDFNKFIDAVADWRDGRDDEAVGDFTPPPALVVTEKKEDNADSRADECEKVLSFLAYYDMSADELKGLPPCLELKEALRYLVKHQVWDVDMLISFLGRT